MQIDDRIYVAGHTGLVGSALVRNLRRRGYRHLITRTHKELDLRRQKDTEDFFSDEMPTHVFLAAAKVGGILANNTYRADFICDNLMISTNIIHSAHKYETEKLLYLGSSCVYPKFAPQPIKEEYLLTGILEQTNEPFAIAKIAAIKLCRAYHEQYGKDFVSVMPASLYGPHDHFDLKTAHVLPTLMRKFHLAKLLKEKRLEEIKMDLKTYTTELPYNEEVDSMSHESTVKTLKLLGISHDAVEIWGSGETYREFLHVDDLADACVFVMERCSGKDLGEFLNIGTGQDIRIKDLAVMIKEIVDFDGEIRYDLSKPAGTPRKVLDISKMRFLGWEPRTSLKEGITKTYEWYVAGAKIKCGKGSSR